MTLGATYGVALSLCEDHRRPVVGRQRTFCGGALPKIIEHWLREELGPVVGPRNPLLLKREMPRVPQEDGKTGDLRSEHTHIDLEPFLGKSRVRQSRFASDREPECGQDEFRAFSTPAPFNGGGSGLGACSIVSRDWTWPEDDEDSIPFRMKTRAVMLLGRLLGKTKLRERETDALWLSLEGASEVSNNKKANVEKKPEYDHEAERGDPPMKLERLVARLLDPCSDAVARDHAHGRRNAITDAVGGFSLTHGRLERAFHALQHENMREHFHQCVLKRRETIRCAALMAPALVNSFLRDGVLNVATGISEVRTRHIASRIAACTTIQTSWRKAKTAQRIRTASQKLYSLVRFRLCRGLMARGWISWQLYVEHLQQEEEGKWLGLQARRGWLESQMQAEAALAVQRVWRGRMGRQIARCSAETWLWYARGCSRSVHIQQL